LKQAAAFAVYLTLLCGCGTTGRNLTPNITKVTLDNGLDVYLLEDHSAPLFTFQYWAKVGSGDEWEGKPGITGLSHFFEHMMFRGTKRYPDFFKEISARGGKLNAFTWLDVTVYWDKLASKDLEFVLDIESDRLEHMTIDFLNLEPEREVVKSERLLRTENSPAGALREASSATAFDQHSYHWPTVGWMRDLNAITIEQARDYHAQYYVPNNAFVILVGDFVTKDATALVQKYFGKFKKREITRTPRKPDAPLKAERRTYVEKPTGTGLFMASYRSPAGADADFVALEVADQLLTGGKTSRLQKALVYSEDAVAKSISSFLFPFVDPSVLMVDVQMLPGAASRVAEDRMSTQIQRLIDEPVPQDELQRAVAQLRAGVVRGMTTTHSRAQMMGFSIRYSGDPTVPWKRLEEYGKVTPADVQRVAAKYLRRTNRVVAHAVDPRKLIGLTEKYLAQYPSRIEDLDAVVIDSMRYGARRAALRRELASIALENDAIALLSKRAAAEAKRLTGNEKALTKLKTYLETGEKGPVKRMAKLMARTTAAQEIQVELRTTVDALGKRLATLESMVGEAATLEKAPRSTALRHRWATSITARATLPAKPKDDTDLGAWALMGLALQHYNQVTVTGVTEALAAAAPKKGPLLAIWNYAHAAQKVSAGRQ